MFEVNWCALLRSKVKSSKGVVRKRIKLLKPHELNKVLLCQEYYRGLKQSTEVKFKDEGTISSNDGKGKRNAMNIQGIVEKLNACTVALSKGNTELKDWINTELETLGKENFVHKAYDETLKSVYGGEFEYSLVVEGGKVQ